MKPQINVLNIPYDEQAQKFLAKTGATIETKLLGSMPYFDDDKENRDVYLITIKRDKKTWSFKFGQSIMNSREYVEKAVEQRNNRGESWANTLRYLHGAIRPPSDYDILAAITKSNPGTFSDFCADFGYDTDSRKAEKTYFAVQDEWSNVNRIFGDVLKKLAEIQ